MAVLPVWQAFGMNRLAIKQSVTCCNNGTNNRCLALESLCPGAFIPLYMCLWSRAHRPWLVHC